MKLILVLYLINLVSLVIAIPFNVRNERIDAALQQQKAAARDQSQLESPPTTKNSDSEKQLKVIKFQKQTASLGSTTHKHITLNPSPKTDKTPTDDTKPTDDAFPAPSSSLTGDVGDHNSVATSNTSKVTGGTSSETNRNYAQKQQVPYPQQQYTDQAQYQQQPQQQSYTDQIQSQPQQQLYVDQVQQQPSVDQPQQQPTVDQGQQQLYVDQVQQQPTVDQVQQQPSQQYPAQSESLPTSTQQPEYSNHDEQPTEQSYSTESTENIDNESSSKNIKDTADSTTAAEPVESTAAPVEEIKQSGEVKEDDESTAVPAEEAPTETDPTQPESVDGSESSATSVEKAVEKNGSEYTTPTPQEDETQKVEDDQQDTTTQVDQSQEDASHQSQDDSQQLQDASQQSQDASQQSQDSSQQSQDDSQPTQDELQQTASDAGAESTQNEQPLDSGALTYVGSQPTTTVQPLVYDATTASNQLPPVISDLLPVAPPQTSTVVVQITPESCPDEIESLGCFRNSGIAPMPLPEIIGTRKSDQTLEDFLCQCANTALTKKYYTFGLASNKCYSGPDEGRYDEDGQSSKCYNDSNKQCTDNDAYCQGTEESIFVYSVITPEHPEVVRLKDE